MVQCEFAKHWEMTRNRSLDSRGDIGWLLVDTKHVTANQYALHAIVAMSFQ